MKVLILVAALLAPTLSFGYQTIIGADPNVTPDAEYKSVKKSVSAGVSDAITEGDLIVVDASNTPTGAFVGTRVGAAQTVVAASGLIIGRAMRSVATGDLGYFLVQNAGYATVKYSTLLDGNAIAIGDRLCVSVTGAAMKCTGAASHSKIIALEAKAINNSGTDLKVLLNAR